MRPPSLPFIPPSSSTVEVSVIDTSFRISELSSSIFFGPDIQGFETFNANAHAFLIKHVDVQTGKQTRILFDLGPPKDWEADLSPAMVERIKGWGAKIEITKNVSEILEANGVPLNSIDAIIWSHPHWDHVGRPSLFPPATRLITGPGVKTAFYPGYPDRSTSPILSREFAGRTVTELDFSASDLVLGGFQAVDFFGNGSLYFLSTPGHAIGHISALARTTAPSNDRDTSNSSSSCDSSSTFILMAADSYHHASMLRPHRHSPLPEIIPNHLPITKAAQELASGQCLGEVFETIHPSTEGHHNSNTPGQYASCMNEYHSDPKTTPFFTISQKPTGETVAVDIDKARATIRGLQELDGDPGILLIAAHDASLAPVLSYFPRTANQWKQQGWKEKGRWRFLVDLRPAVELARKK